MVIAPDIYTGAHFTVRYDECVERIPEFYQDSHMNWMPFGIDTVWQFCEDHGFVYYSSQPTFTQLRATIVDRFEMRNWRKELGAETPDEWFRLACMRLTEVAEKYEPILKMEATAGFDVSNPNKESRIIEYGHVIEGQVQDTPYGQLDAASDYVSGKTAEQHSGQDTIHERNELDADILMDLRRKWDATINKIIEEFDTLFIRITGADFVA